MKNTLINLALFCGVLSAMVGIQAVDNHGAEQEVAREQLTKQRQQDRFEQAAKAVCGDNARWSQTDVPGQIICKTRMGHTTKVAQL